MKKLFLILIVPAMLLAFTSCGGSSANTPEGVSASWCELEKAVKAAAEGEAKEKAKEAREKFEKEVETAHKGDEEFMKKVKELTRECDK